MFHVSLDVSGLTDLLQTSSVARRVLKQAAMQLTQQTKEHIMQEANKRLHTRRKMYIEGLSAFQENDHTWVISLDARVRWIDDGLRAHNMLDDLLKSPKAKTSKDGTSKYIVIPFQHKKGPTEATPAQQALTSTIKSELRGINALRRAAGAEPIPYGKIESNADGSPKLGVLHKFNITDSPLKTHEGAGQGWGDIGQVRQGPTGIPFLQGVQIRQRMAIDQKGKQQVVREILTFRVASSKQRAQKGRWDMPNIPAVPLMQEAAAWAKEHWETNVAPKLFDMIKAEL